MAMRTQAEQRANFAAVALKELMERNRDLPTTTLDDPEAFMTNVAGEAWQWADAMMAVWECDREAAREARAAKASPGPFSGGPYGEVS